MNSGKYYYVREVMRTQGRDGGWRNAGSKARDDTEAILEACGFAPIEVCQTYTFAGGNPFRKIYRNLNILRIWKQALKALKQGDSCVIQIPVLTPTLLFDFVLHQLKRQGVRLVVFVHDINSLRLFHEREPLPRRLLKVRLTHHDRNMLDHAWRVIVHNDAMKAKLNALGWAPAGRMIPLRMFDYLIPDSGAAGMRPREKARELIIAGNLSASKAGYIYKLPEGCHYNLYGVGYEGQQDEHVSYRGSFEPEELPYVMVGGFGLVWDGDSVETCSGPYGDYMRINNPHKASLYLVSSIPVIAWSQSALTAFISENNCGFTVSSLKDIADIIDNMTAEEYETLRANAARVGKKLRDGAYTRDALKRCFEAYEHTD